MEIQNLVNFNSEETKKFLDSFDTVVTDCDGVLWLGNTVIEGSFETLKKLKSVGKRILFVSNNGTLSPKKYCEKFRLAGYTMCPDDIAIPSIVISWYLKSQGFDGKAFVIGTGTFINVLRDGGIDVVEPTVAPLEENFEAIITEYKKCPEVEAVVVDLDINVNWSKLGRAIRYLKNSEVIFVTGAVDKKIPVARNVGLLGNGVFVDIVSKESNRQPVCCGKPSEIMRNYIRDKFQIENPGRCLFIGDSLENDMKFADLCGFSKLWVGTGVDTPESSPMKDASSIPDYYLPSLGLLTSLLEALSHSDYE